MWVTERAALALVVFAVFATGCKKKEGSDVSSGSGAAPAGTATATGSERGSAEAAAESVPPPATPRPPLPAATVVDQPGTALKEAKAIAIGDVVEGEIRDAEEGKAPPANEHYYRFDSKSGEKLKIEWGVRAIGGGFAFNAVVIDEGENIVVPEIESFSDQAQGWVRTEADSELPPITTARPLIVKIVPNSLYTCCGRYRFRIVR